MTKAYPVFYQYLAVFNVFPYLVVMLRASDGSGMDARRYWYAPENLHG